MDSMTKEQAYDIRQDKIQMVIDYEMNANDMNIYEATMYARSLTDEELERAIDFIENGYHQDYGPMGLSDDDFI